MKSVDDYILCYPAFRTPVIIPSSVIAAILENIVPHLVALVHVQSSYLHFHFCSITVSIQRLTFDMQKMRLTSPLPRLTSSIGTTYISSR